ncbi:MAG: MMPL family transporter [Candidatus Choladocola sp.]|nr:MMPL family transporter [Candidatus Choladocola sp.]
MKKLGEKIVRWRVPIFVLSILLLIPSFLGMIHTRVNYDILSYLPEEIETVKGQNILAEEFGTGAFSLFIVEGMEPKDVSALRSRIEEVDHVAKAVWYDSLLDLSVPMSMLPDKITEIFNSKDATMMAIIFDTTTSADETMEAISEIRKIAGKQCFLSGMSAVVTDTKELSEKEVPAYVLIAVILSAIVIALAMDSFLLPVLFLLSIGMAIIYNLGSNYFLGEISYITKALSAVLQLGVTMDYSIFLWHSYSEQKQIRTDKNEAMAEAIAATIQSVSASSITTVAGFLALCFMSFTLGLDLGIVMAKGVVFGVLTCILVLPAMILIFDRAIEKTSHRPVLKDLPGLSEFVTKHYILFAVLFLVLIGPAWYAQAHTDVYYNLDETLPEDLPSSVANRKLQEDFHTGATHILLVDSSLGQKEVTGMIREMEKVDGVKYVLGIESVLGPMIPESMIPEELLEIFKNENYEMMMIGTEYRTASDEVNHQITELNAIIRKYDPSGMLVGEAPCTKDLITITDKDFKVVNVISIAAVFIIILITFRNLLLPVLLVAVIELAIFLNLGIPYLTGTELPFIASIVIGTIQLGATVDYAILITTRYRLERQKRDKREAVLVAHQTSVKSVIISALSFFAATIGVGCYSDIDMISSLCMLMARGAIISMVVVLAVLPAMLLIFDRFISQKTVNE